MLKLPKADYAIILLTHLCEVNTPASAQKVAEHYQLPYRMVANILLLVSYLINNEKNFTDMKNIEMVLHPC